MVDKTINLRSYYYIKSEVDGYLANKSNINHGHGNIDQDGKVTSICATSDVKNILVTDKSTNNVNKVTSISNIPSTKIIHESKTLDTILGDLYNLIDENRTEESKNEVVLVHPLMDSDYSSIFFTKLGNLVIIEFGMRSANNGSGTIPSSYTHNNTNYSFNSDSEFWVGNIPTGFVPTQSNKYFDMVSLKGSGITRIILNTDGKIYLHATANKPISTYGSGIYLLDTKTYRRPSTS